MKFIASVIAVCLAVVAFPLALSAGPAASAWERNPYASARLLAGGEGDAGVLVGVQIRLEPGWKTYWRVPGESGVPPRFDWSRSSNVASVRVDWPAPVWHEDSYSTSIVYENEVVFPVTILRQTDDMPTIVRLDLAYAACRDICVPARASLVLDLSRVPETTTAETVLLERYRRQVPQSLSPDEAGVERAVLNDDGDTLGLVLHGRDADPVRHIFVEGPSGYLFGRPRKTGAPEGVETFEVPVSGGQSAGGLRGRSLRVTIHAASRAVETEIAVK